MSFEQLIAYFQTSQDKRISLTLLTVTESTCTPKVRVLRIGLFHSWPHEALDVLGHPKEVHRLYDASAELSTNVRGFLKLLLLTRREEQLGISTQPLWPRASQQGACRIEL